MNKKNVLISLFVPTLLMAAGVVFSPQKDPELARLADVKAGQAGNDGGECYDYENYEGCKSAFTFCATQTPGQQPELGNPGWWHCDTFRCDATHNKDVEVTCPGGYADPKVLPANLLSNMKDGLKNPYSLKDGKCKEPSHIKWCAGESVGGTTTWVVMNSGYNSHAVMPNPCLGFQTQQPPANQKTCSRWFGDSK